MKTLLLIIALAIPSCQSVKIDMSTAYTDSPRDNFGPIMSQRGQRQPRIMEQLADRIQDRRSRRD